MAPWVRTVTGGGREEQMQEQDKVLSASATMWDRDYSTVFAWLRTEALSLTGIASSNAASVPCLDAQRQHRVMPRRMGRCS